MLLARPLAARGAATPAGTSLQIVFRISGVIFASGYVTFLQNHAINEVFVSKMVAGRAIRLRWTCSGRALWT